MLSKNICLKLNTQFYVFVKTKRSETKNIQLSFTKVEFLKIKLVQLFNSLPKKKITHWKILLFHFFTIDLHFIPKKIPYIVNGKITRQRKNNRFFFTEEYR